MNFGFTLFRHVTLYIKQLVNKGQAIKIVQSAYVLPNLGTIDE